MKILAIESSGCAASAAILEDENILAEKTGPFKVTHSETLLPLINEAFAECRLKPQDVDLIAVSGGPGSFTGLRIGSASAKGLGMALGKDLVHVPTLDAMAMNFEDSKELIIPMMDARRGQVYTGIYKFEGANMVTLLAGCAMAADELMKLINEQYQQEKIVILGDGAGLSYEKMKEVCNADIRIAPDEKILQKASCVGKLGYRLAMQGKTVKAADEAPEYLRPSQAERVKAEGAN